jgi:hypothetical protein
MFEMVMRRSWCVQKNSDPAIRCGVLNSAATLTKDRTERVVQSKDCSTAMLRNFRYGNQLDVICTPAPTRCRRAGTPPFRGATT